MRKFSCQLDHNLNGRTIIDGNRKGNTWEKTKKIKKRKLIEMIEIKESSMLVHNSFIFGMDNKFDAQTSP